MDTARIAEIEGAPCMKGIRIMTLRMILSVIIFSCCGIAIVSPILDLASGKDFGMLRWNLVALQLIALAILVVDIVIS